MKTFYLLIISAVLINCTEQPKSRGFDGKQTEAVNTEVVLPKFDPVENAPEDRVEIEQNLSVKIDSGIPLVVHCLVPLCDNDHQGIVPTSESLGDGFSLRTNLYWATSYGMKKYFDKSVDWKNISIKNFIPNDTILERAVFQRTFENGSDVVLICDAYRGDMMSSCLDDFLNALAGFHRDSIDYNDGYLNIAQEADMMVFNGHNGLMDVRSDTAYAREKRLKDAVVIACSSKSYFNPYFVQCNAYPLLNTTSLLWPGAMILDAVIENWATLKTDEEIKNAAGDAYHEVKDCGRAAARKMFCTGWG